MEDNEIIEALRHILESKSLTQFERVQLEEVIESIIDRLENPVLTEDLPTDSKKKYHAVYRKRVGLR